MEDLVIALKSEVLGEAFFRSAYYATFYSDRRNKAKTLWQLEIQTKTRIIEYFKANNLKIPQLKWAAFQGIIFGILYLVVPWEFVMKEILKETTYYLEVFRRLEEQATEQDKELFKYIVAHEVAIRRFAEIELINNSSSSLKSIESLLNN